MDSKQFLFRPARIIEPDIGRNVPDFLTSGAVKISDESIFSLLEHLLMRTPIRVVFKVLKELYLSSTLTFSTDSEFAVQTILGRSLNKGKVYYWVKWDGWPVTFNTWEPEENVQDCERLISEFLAKAPSLVSIVKYEYNATKAEQINEVLDRLREALPLSNLSALEMLQLFFNRLPKEDSKIRRFRQTSTKVTSYVEGYRPKALKRPRLTAKSEAVLKEAIRSFEERLNEVYSHEASIVVENNVDMECPPNEFQPIKDYIPSDDVYLATKAVVGCECHLDRQSTENSDRPPKPAEMEPCWINRHAGCCAVRSGGRIPYSINKRLIVPPGHAVFECNSACSCGPSCPFRVVQLGRKVPLAVFRTSNGRGWGVKALSRIWKGTFVTEYLGEIITFEGAEQRGELYDKQRMTYLFDLDFDDEAHYTVDALNMGNVSHFINHSCDPNLTVRCTFIECLNTKLPRLALFAARNICRNEELTFDYQMTGAREGSDDEDNATCSSSNAAQSDSSEKPGTSVTSSPHSDIIKLGFENPSEGSSSGPPDNISEVSSVSKTNSNPTKRIKMKCLCGSSKCRGYLVN